MDTVVGPRWLQVSNGPFSIKGSGDSDGHVNVMTTEASESVIFLVIVSIFYQRERCNLYFSIR